MEMPAPDDAVLRRRAEIVEALRQIVPGEGVIVSEAERRAYETDGLTAYHQLPMVVVLPSRVDQVAAVLRYCQKNGVKVVPRGAGTSLSGGALPLADGVLQQLAAGQGVPEAGVLQDRRAVRRPEQQIGGRHRAVDEVPPVQEIQRAG